MPSLSAVPTAKLTEGALRNLYDALSDYFGEEFEPIVEKISKERNNAFVLLRVNLHKKDGDTAEIEKCGTSIIACPVTALYTSSANLHSELIEMQGIFTYPASQKHIMLADKMYDIRGEVATNPFIQWDLDSLDECDDIANFDLSEISLSDIIVNRTDLRMVH